MTSKAWACALFVLATAPAVAQTCDLPGGQKIESPRYWLAYRTRPDQVRIGEHFAIDLVVCPKNGQPAPEGVQVDGFMPEHSHGMNYKAVVKPAGTGHYEASGLMFHMPGRWDFIFEVRGGGRTDKVTHSVTLQ
jgi:hypothetical protein